MYCVTTYDSEWLIKGYINSSGSIFFDIEAQANEYLNNWLSRNKGYGRIEQKEWVEKEQPLVEYPLPVKHDYKIIPKWNKTNYGRW